MICALFSCAPQSGPPTPGDQWSKAVPFCSVAAEPKVLVDQPLLIRGLFADTPHGGLLYGTGCEEKAITLRGSENSPDDKEAGLVLRRAIQQDSAARVEVIMFGILRQRPETTPCSREACMRYELEETRLVAALAK